MAAGAIIALINPALLVDKGEQINGAVHIYAGYLFSRNLAIAAVLVAALTYKARSALKTLLLSLRQSKLSTPSSTLSKAVGPSP